MTKRLGRAGALAALVGSLLASTMIVSAGPAQATQNACRRDFYMTHVGTPWRVAVVNQRVCWDPDSETYFPTTLEKLVGQTWVLVGQGAGYAGYLCDGFTSTTFRANGGALQATYPCG